MGTMANRLEQFHRWLITGSDRKLFYRSLIFLMLLVGSIQIAAATGIWLSYGAAFALALAYVYLWLELLRRFARKDSDHKDREEKNDSDKGKGKGERRGK